MGWAATTQSNTKTGPSKEDDLGTLGHLALIAQHCQKYPVWGFFFSKKKQLQNRTHIPLPYRQEKSHFRELISGNGCTEQLKTRHKSDEGVQMWRGEPGQRRVDPLQRGEALECRTATAPVLGTESPGRTKIWCQNETGNVHDSFILILALKCSAYDVQAEPESLNKIGITITGWSVEQQKTSLSHSMQLNSTGKRGTGICDFSARAGGHQGGK